jgi:hypothetical protein
MRIAVRETDTEQLGTARTHTIKRTLITEHSSVNLMIADRIYLEDGLQLRRYINL